MRHSWIFGLALVACAPPPPRSIPRVVDGEVEQGPSVSPYAYHWFIRGEVETTRDAYEAAALAFETARTATSEDVLLLTRLAESYERVNQRRQADRALEEAKRIAPSSELVWLAQGRIYEARRKSEQALRAYRRADQLNPRSASGPTAIARLLRSHGQDARAQAVLEGYVRRTEAARTSTRRAYVELARHRGDFATVIDMARDTQAPPIVSEARSTGRTAARRGMPLAASRLLEVSASSRQDMHVLVDTLIGSGQQGEAEALLGTPPKNRFGDTLDRAELYLRTGRADTAAQLAVGATDSPRARYLLGAARLAQHRYDDAARAFASVPYGSKDHANARRGLVTCLTALGQPGVALELIERRATPEEPLRIASANLYDALGEHAAALKILASDRSIEQLARARLLERLGRRREANAQYRGVDVRRIDDEDARRRIVAERALAEGALDVASTELLKLRRMAPQDLWARARLAEVLEQQGDTVAAERERAALRLVAYEEAMVRWLGAAR